MELKKQISERLHSNRPNLSANSVKTYTSLLFNIQKKLNKKVNSMEWYANSEDAIIQSLDATNDVTKKTILSAYYVLEGKANTKDHMIKSAKIVNDKYTENKKSLKQEENWMDQKEVQSVYDKYKKQMLAITKKKVINETELMILRDYMILCFYVLNKPRRSLDLAELKIKNVNKKGNYIEKNQYVFNIYKTNKFYGEDRINIDPEAIKFIKIWKKYNNTDYLVFNNKQEQMTSSQITRALNSIFGKQIGVSMLRHIYLTSRFGDVNIKELKDTAKDMSHSLSTALEYVKNK